MCDTAPSNIPFALKFALPCLKSAQISGQSQQLLRFSSVAEFLLLCAIHVLQDYHQIGQTMLLPCMPHEHGIGRDSCMTISPVHNRLALILTRFELPSSAHLLSALNQQKQCALPVTERPLGLNVTDHWQGLSLRKAPGAKTDVWSLVQVNAALYLQMCILDNAQGPLSAALSLLPFPTFPHTAAG